MVLYNEEKAFTHFNSIKVRLELADADTCEQVEADFNSIKVRLEHAPYHRGMGGHPFQFHKGAIRTIFDCKRSIYSTISIP